MAAIAPPTPVPTTHSVTLNLGVIGMGAVGSILAVAWKQTGHSLVGVTMCSISSRKHAAVILLRVQFISSQELCVQVDLLVPTVWDIELVDLVESLASQGVFRVGQPVAHTTDAFGLEVLSPVAGSGATPLALHPVQIFSGVSLDLARLHGCFWAINAPLALLPVTQALMLDTGGIPRVLADGARPLYYAALAYGVNCLTTLVTQTLRAPQAVGIEDSISLAQSFVRAALERALQEGEAGPFGPISHGDASTIVKHLQALENGQWRDSEDLNPTLSRGNPVDLLNAYRALVAATAARILNCGGINELQYKQIESILGNCAPAGQER